jgi:hypothetical protein
MYLLYLGRFDHNAHNAEEHDHELGSPLLLVLHKEVTAALLPLLHLAPFFACLMESPH